MEKFKFLLKDRISRLPKAPGVYVFLARRSLGEGGKQRREFLYIGKAANLRERVKNHFQQPTFRDRFLLNQVKQLGYIKTDSEIEALILEANLIKKYQPKYNVVWRDDKNYFFVAKTEEDFPRIFWTHQTKLKPKTSGTRGAGVKPNYVGPFVDGKALKQTLKILRKIFPFRSCSKIPNRSCLWYHLNRCPAPCLLKSKIVKEIPINSLKLKKISQRNAKNLIKILKEGKNPVLKELKKEMKILAKIQDFEEAAKIRDQIKALERIMEHTKIFETSDVDVRRQHENWRKIQRILQKMLKTKKTISRMEAYDISNIQGQQATGAMVTFINGQPNKNFYRKFRIKITGKPNDIAMIKEILSRRFKHLEWGLPDLILIDGGKAQLNATLQCCSTCHVEQIKILAIAKRENELFIEGEKSPVLLKKLPREIFNLILQLRDEAHRFAISYHRKLRMKSLVK